MCGHTHWNTTTYPYSCHTHMQKKKMALGEQVDIVFITFLYVLFV